MPVGLIGTDEVQPIDRKMPRLFRPGHGAFRRAARSGRYRDFDVEHLALRELTDEVMYEIGQLSGYEYVDTYATKKAEDIPIDVARVASFEDVRTPESRGVLDSGALLSAPKLAGSLDRAVPRRQARVALGGIHRGHERGFGLPRRVDVGGGVPHPFGDAGEERRAERGRLLHRGAAHRDAEEVGLELAEQVHHRRAAVDAHLRGRSAARAGDRVDDVGGLERHRLDDGAREVRPPGAARDADDRAAARRRPTTANRGR